MLALFILAALAFTAAIGSPVSALGSPVVSLSALLTASFSGKPTGPWSGPKNHTSGWSEWSTGYSSHQPTPTDSVLPAQTAASTQNSPPPKPTHSSLEVDSAPNDVRPYIIRHLASSHALQLTNSIFRFPVTGNSSGGAFSIITFSGPSTPFLAVYPHIHYHYYETFYALKGRLQLWTQQGDGVQNARSLTAGDMGCVGLATNHTFQFTDPDTELVGVYAPGGFEKFFMSIGNATYPDTLTPFPPMPIGDAPSLTEAEMAQLQVFDIYASPNSFVPRRDLVNGTIPEDNTWHREASTLPLEAHTPYYTANSWGPKWLSNELGFYQIIQPLVGPVNSANNSFTVSTLSIDGPKDVQPSPVLTQVDPSAFMVTEGLLAIAIGAHNVSHLATGDVAFIPGNTPYQYYSKAAFTKVLYTSSGFTGLDRQLIAAATETDYVVFPMQWNNGSTSV